MRYLTSYGVALVLILLIVGWLASGTLIQGGNGPGNGETPMVSLFGGEAGEPADTPPAEEGAAPAAPADEAEGEEEEAQLQSVRVASFTAQDMPIQVSLRGRTQSNASVTVRAETSGIVQEVHASKGQRVAPNDLLCTLDSGTREARVAQAEAALAQAQLNLETNATLRERGLAAPNTANSFEVALKSAQSTLDDARAELERTVIRAEVAGLVQDPLANPGDMLSVGGTCATLVELDPILFVGKVAEARIGQVHEGMPATVSTVTGQTVEGTVRYISSTADAATRSFAIEIEVPNPDQAIRDGVTAEAVIHVGTAQAHLLPQSVLTLDDEGTIGIKTVEGDVAHFRPAELLRDTTEGVWIGGLPPEVTVITLGQEYVTDGQKVDATLAGEGA